MTDALLAGPTLNYVLVDVFVPEAAEAFTGNPLAVVLGGEDLMTAQCQALAVEFHLSETVFALEPTEAGANYRARIFTISSELPYAGHPSVGAAWTLARLGRIAPGRVVQECGAGLLELEVPNGEGAVTLTGPVPAVSGPVDAAPLLSALGLRAADVMEPPPRVSGTGVAFAFLRVREEALARVRPDLAALGSLDGGVTGVYVFALDQAPASAEADLRVHARLFAADIGGEDPATGSAAIALGGFLVGSGLIGDDAAVRYEIRQGAEMGRPSVLLGSVQCRGGRIQRVQVGGRVAVVGEGRIRLPRPSSDA